MWRGDVCVHARGDRPPGKGKGGGKGTAPAQTGGGEQRMCVGGAGVHGDGGAHLDVDDEGHGGELGDGGVEGLEGDVAGAVPYFEGDDSAGGRAWPSRVMDIAQRTWGTDALEVVLGDLGGGLEIEGLFGGEAVEGDLLDGGLAAPARGREMRDGTELEDGSADLRMPSRRIFVLARSSPLGSVGRERAVAMAGARGGERGRGRRG